MPVSGIVLFILTFAFMVDNALTRVYTMNVGVVILF